MAGRNDWMPRTIGGQIEMMRNVARKIGNYATELGLTPAEVAKIVMLCEEFLSVAEHASRMMTAGRASLEWRDHILKGKPVGSPAPSPPQSTAYSPVSDPVVGVIALFREWRERIVAAAGYTRAIGDDLMIVKAAAEHKSESEIQPKLKVTAEQSDHRVAIIVTERERADAWTVEIRRKGGEWQAIGTFTGRSVNIAITPTTPGEPEQIEMRVLLRRKNRNYGLLSQVATVTINP